MVIQSFIFLTHSVSLDNLEVSSVLVEISIISITMETNPVFSKREKSNQNIYLAGCSKYHKPVTVHGSVCSFCVRLCGWTRSLCLSALPSDRAPDEVIRTVTAVARLHCLYLAGVSVVRCQNVFTLVVFLLSVSVFQVLRLFSPGRVSVFP